MDHTRDLYSILGLPFGAHPDDIKKQYRRLVKRLHTDHNAHPGAVSQFRDIAEAYEILNDSTQRTQYINIRERLAENELAYFFVDVTSSKDVVSLLGEPQVVYYLIEISPNQALRPEVSNRKTPLNLTIVLDRSKSMLGTRLERVKIAAHQIIDQLSAEDYLSIVSFSDRAEPIIKSQAVVDKIAMKTMVSTMAADGGTEIYQGLSVGYHEVKKHLSNDTVNHIILVTDGETFDNENDSFELAELAASEGIGISPMGIGEDWNDVFLDELAAKTGGSSAYINSPQAVVRFLNDRVRSLGAAFGERMQLSLAPDPDIQIESIFKLSPNPQPMDVAHYPIILGSLEASRPIKVLVQLQLPGDLSVGTRALMRVDVQGDIIYDKCYDFKAYEDKHILVSEEADVSEPPRNILDALGKLTLYRMQQKAEASIKAGNFDEATRRLENLATRLLDAGQAELAATVMDEVKVVQQTKAFSAEGQKTMKFGTRLLLESEI